MNVSSRVRYDRRFAQLAKQGEIVFHTRDLANLWGITDTNTLYTTLKRYVQRGLLHRIYKGLYSLVPIDQIDPVILGTKAIHAYVYLSTESILVQAGVLSQSITSITLISSTSLRFSIGEYSYRVRQLTDTYLHQPIGIEYRDGVYTAGTERAIADLLHFNPRAYFDNPRVVNWNEVKKIQETIGYTYNIPQ